MACNLPEPKECFSLPNIRPILDSHCNRLAHFSQFAVSVLYCISRHAVSLYLLVCILLHICVLYTELWSKLAPFILCLLTPSNP